MQEFLEVRKRWDPKGVFLNEFLEDEIFQLATPFKAALPVESTSTDDPQFGGAAKPLNP